MDLSRVVAGWLSGSRHRGSHPGRAEQPIDDASRPVSLGLLLFLLLCLVGGGSNLPSVPSLVVLRPAGILFIAALLMMPTSPRASSMRMPLLLLAAFTASIAVQLIPLPPSLWARIPGRAGLAEMVTALGEGGRWRPLSLTPSITLSSLMATLPAWVVVLAFTRLPRRRHRALAGVIVLMATASCIVGLLQMIGGANSLFYFYKSDGSVSGLLGNRNHQAALLAVTLPLLRVWMLGGPADALVRRGVTATLLGVLMLGMILLTGSRAGLVLAGIGTVAAYSIAPGSWNMIASEGQRKPGNGALPARITRWGLLALPVLLVALTILVGRDLSIQRLFTTDYTNETRLRALPTTVSLVGNYFPFGSGFGSFDTVFRLHEPDGLLKPTFFNRAHNDFLELAITGGAFSLLVLAGFLCWVMWMAVRAFRRPWREEGVLHARAGVVTVLLFGVASLSDYPLRAPLCAVVAAIAVCWIAPASRRTPSRAVRRSLP